MPVEHLSAEAAPETLGAVLERDGCCVVDRVVSRERMDALRQELSPWLDATRSGPDDFTGRSTRRTGGLVARSKIARELVQHPLVLGTVKRVLHRARNFQLHLTQVIAIGPGESAQAIHRDQWAFDFFPFPNGYEVQCNTIWAMSDFTERNGATRVIPGSHRAEDHLRFRLEDTEPAEMEQGSVLLYTGSIYHGGGPNRSDETRYGVNLTYTVGWLRQEENQYLSVPREIARELDEPLLRLLGYAKGAYALGYLDDLRDPIEAVRPELGRTGFGDLDDAQQKLREEARGALPKGACG
jgi:ectoine hydroxylase-related dioxygenase (phytanoyl-CoA dioxygenase family)